MYHLTQNVGAMCIYVYYSIQMLISHCLHCIIWESSLQWNDTELQPEEGGCSTKPPRILLNWRPLLMRNGLIFLRKHSQGCHHSKTVECLWAKQTDHWFSLRSGPQTDWCHSLRNVVRVLPTQQKHQSSPTLWSVSIAQPSILKVWDWVCLCHTQTQQQ